MSTSDKIKIALLYFILFTGGLWHILNFFQTIMSYLAGPLLIGLSIWFYFEIRIKRNNERFSKFNTWSIIVVIASFFIETIGVKTGLIFGTYFYGTTLWPQIMDVPIAIGFAWFLMLICSIALMQRIPIINNANIWIQMFIISILMTFFDFMMEPAAIKLNYWNWYRTIIPLQNYLAWFVISFILTILAWQMKVLGLKFPKVVMHGYYAQLIYFIMIMFK